MFYFANRFFSAACCHSSGTEADSRSMSTSKEAVTAKTEITGRTNGRTASARHRVGTISSSHCRRRRRKYKWMTPVDDWLDANRSCMVLIDRDDRRPVSGSLSSVATGPVKWRSLPALNRSLDEERRDRTVARRGMIRQNWEEVMDYYL